MIDEKPDDVGASIADAWDELEAKDAPPAEPAVEEPPAEGPVRDEHGRFAKKQSDEPAPAAAPQEETTALQSTEPAVQGQPFQPPPGWSVSAKAAFDQLPDPVKQAIAHREEEINRGFEKLRDYKGPDSYVQWSQQQYGIPLPQVIDAYRAADMTLQQDFTGGILNLFQRYGADPVQWAQQLLAQVSPPDSQQLQGRPSQGDPRLMQHLQTLEQRLQRFEQESQSAKETRINAEIEAFSADPAHRFFDNVSDRMAELISTGQAADLKDAYDKACWLDPEIRALRIKDEVAKSQPQPSLPKRGSSPAAGSPVPDAGPGKSATKGSLRDDLMSAWNELSPSI